uniref:Cullin family profile domain-containing protein n=1 Tax=Bicosoecida sp. CB-2014 TaxID=1486930 RepID=A0A7S1G733_9STRA|mmetsp:Transcript_19306/g.68223  ORF Transcript_19306/g.68223 Transcript_19306/m.68223 type:complete len:743 (+) Transcript_19306:307-2535(+)
MAATGAPIPLDDGWRSIRSRGIEPLEHLLDADFDRERGNPFTRAQYAEIYTICYNMCTQRAPMNFSQQLYERHGETVATYLRNNVLPALERQHDTFLLQELVKRWQNHEVMNKWLFKFFMYLDRYYVSHHGVPKLKEAGLDKFRTVVFDVVKRDVVVALLAVINQDREGEVVDRYLVKNVVSVFVAMGEGTLDTYRHDLEEPLLADTREFYGRRAAAWLAGDSTPAYLIKAEEALNAEADRVQRFLDPESEQPLLRVVEHELLKRHESELLEQEASGCRALLRDEKHADLARMYSLFSRVEQGLVSVARMVKDHIQEMGLAIVEEREAAAARSSKESPSDPTFVQALLELHDKMRALVRDQFKNNTLFQTALKDAFEFFINKEVRSKYSNAEMIAHFCDRILKPGSERMSEAQIEELLERIVQLFAFISDKDLFAEIYRNQLAKRLLNARSVSNDSERSMVSKLKLRCGAQFTGRIEGMMNDLSLGAEEQAAFGEHMAKLDSSVMPSLKFNVTVLTTGFWPSYKIMDVHLPTDMATCLETFEAYYKVKTSHRKLSWVHSLGTATLKATYKKGYELQVTTLQAVVLLLFNERDGAVSFEDIRSALNVDEEVAKRLLHSLSCGKYQALKKTPKGRTISTDDTFAFNDGFSCSYKRIRIPMPSLDETHNPKRVQEDRSNAIEAAAVRIMKTRKTMSHQELVTEVLKQLHLFKPNPKVIKRRIEHLIEREYLERDPDKTNVYRYLA